MIFIVNICFLRIFKLRKYHFYILYSLIFILFAMIFFQSNLGEEPDRSYEEIHFKQSNGEEATFLIPEPKVRIFELPSELFFAQESVPIDQQEIRERFEREIYVNAYWQSNMILLMKRSNKFLPVIEEIFRENDIPDDFKFLAMAESGLLNVVSPAGARGFWQFMPVTAKEYQLEVTDEVDERYHLEKSTVAASKYLKKSFAKFQNWTSVAASYNMGISGYNRRKDEQQLDSYYDLLLNDETSRYLFRVLAFKEIFERPQHYGFHLNESDLYSLPLYRILKVNHTITDLAKWAIENKSSYKELKIHNPWLRSGKLSVSKGKEYFIKLPI